MFVEKRRLPEKGGDLKALKRKTEEKVQDALDNRTGGFFGRLGLLRRPELFLPTVGSRLSSIVRLETSYPS